MTTAPSTPPPAGDPFTPPGPIEAPTTVVDLVRPIVRHWRALVLTPLLAAGIGFGVTYVWPPTYTAVTTLLPPEQRGSSASAALQSLGTLAGLAGLGAVKTTTDQYAALLQSVTVQDRLIERFDLLKVYDEDFKVDARRELTKRMRVSIGKKDGLLTIEVDDRDPKRAADLANQHVEELRTLTSTLAITEAQQRRTFFETRMREAQAKLVEAQTALQSSGFSQEAIKAEPKAAAEGYARLRAELTTAQVRLQALRNTLTEGAVEVRQQQTLVTALSAQLARLEQAQQPAEGRTQDTGYLSRYREFKYQESLFEAMARQFELARLDESREGTLIQVVDAATVPEKRSKPRRILVTAGAALGTLVALLLAFYVRDSWRRATTTPAGAAALARLRQD